MQRGADIDGEAAGDESGTSVSLSSDGSILAVGAYYNDGNGINSGHVRVFKWDGSKWNKLGPDIDGEAAYNSSGSAVSLSSDGSILAVGAFYNNGNGMVDAGHVRVYGTKEPPIPPVVTEDSPSLTPGDEGPKMGTVRLIKSSECEFPDKVSIEFLLDRPVFYYLFSNPNGKLWQPGFLLGDNTAYVTDPLSVRQFKISGNSLSRTFHISEFKKDSTDITLDSWVGQNLSFFVLRIKSDGTRVFKSTSIPKGLLPVTTSPFSPENPGAVLANTTSLVNTKSNLGAVSSKSKSNNCGSLEYGFGRAYASDTTVVSDQVTFLDPLLGEEVTLFSAYNDTQADSLTVYVCLDAPAGIPNSENFDLNIFENGPNQLFDDGVSASHDGDSVLVDSMFTTDGGLTFSNEYSPGAQKCWAIQFVFNGDGTNGFIGIDERTPGTNFIKVAASAKDCSVPGDLTLGEAKPTSFKASWTILGGATGHKFKAYLYQDDAMVADSLLGNSRPDTSSNFVREWLWDASELEVTGDTLYSYTVDGLIPCTSYQFWVMQICDGMNTPSDTTWVGAQIKTFGEAVVISEADVTDEECGLNKGSVSFDFTGGACGARQVDVLLVMTGDTIIGIDTASWFSWADPDSSGFSLDDGVVTYSSPTDSLAAGNYTATLTVRDTFGSTYTEVRNFTVDLVDNTNPTAILKIEDSQIGACFYVNTSGDVEICNIYGRLSLDTLTNIIDLGTLTAVTGSCGMDMDFLLENLTDNCTESEDIEVSVVSIDGDVSGTVYPGQDSSSRTVHVQLGAGDFNFEIRLNDKQTNPGENVNKFTFMGTVLDQTAPVVTLPGNNVYQIAECATTTDVFFTIQANDACEGSVDVSAAVTVSDGLTATYVSNGMFRIEDVSAGTYTVTVSGVSDAAGNEAAAQTFSLIVNASGVIVPRQIVGAGDIVATIPACQDEANIHFDLFIVDECVESTGFADVVATGGYIVTGDRSGNSFAISGAGAGETITVTATSGAASYSFDITTQSAAANAAPDITIQGNLTYTLPVCSLDGEAVTFAVQIDDDCTDLEALAASATFVIDGDAITPTFVSTDGGQVYFEFTEVMSINNNGSVLSVTATDNNGLVSSATGLITVLQEAAADEYACEDNVIIRLDGEDCGAAVTPAMVLKGDESTICNDLLQVIVEKIDANGNFDGYEKDHVTGVGTRRYMVYSAALDIPASAYGKTSQFFVNRNDMICWGTLTTEDKSRPTLVCPEDRYTADRPTAYNVWEGSIAAGREFYPQVFSCYQATTKDGYISEIPTEPVPPYFPPYLDPHAEHYYTTWTFRPVVDGKYTIHLFAEFDGGMSLFQQPGLYTDINEPGYPRSNAGEGNGDGWFDVSLPCSNVVAFGESTFGSDPFAGLGNADNWLANDNDWAINGDAVQRMSLPMNAGKEYTLVVTSREPFVEGDFTVLVERDGATTQAQEILRYWNPTADQWGNEVARWTTYPRTVELLDQPLYCDDINNIVINPTDDRCYTISGSYTNPTWNGVTGGINKNSATISDFLADRLLSTGFPTVSDNCGPITVCVSDLVSQHGDCGELYITRSFSATDQYGNKAEFSPGVYTCTQQINFSVPSISELTLPHFTAYLECDEAFATDAAGNPSPSVTGYPFMRSAFGYHDLADEWCNLAATYSDEAKIPGCDDGYKLRREWTVLDWCRPGKSVIYNQLIKVGDFTPPVIDASSIVANNAGLDDSDMLTYAVNPFDCDADFRVPVPAVYDNCTDWIMISYVIVQSTPLEVYDHFGNLVDDSQIEEVVIREGMAGGMIRDIALTTDRRSYRYEFTATDDCGNASSVLKVPFRVIDNIEPTAVCDGGITVTLGGGSYDLDNNKEAGGYARIMKQDLQEGISDNCGVADYQVRRKGATNWAEFVEFDCSDIGTPVEVELRVVDNSGNESLCWLNVTVEDKTKPYCVAPDDFWGYCTDLPEDFNPPATTAEYTAMSDAAKAALHAQLDELFGASEMTDNCTEVTEYQSVTAISWHCGAGTISRKFWGVDAYGNQTPQVCVQTITIDLRHEYSFTFPADATGDCAAVIDVYDVNTQNTGCDLMSVYTTDRTYEASGDECYKVFRTFEVVNWCQFNGTDLALANPFIVGRDEDKDGKPGNRSVAVSFSNVEQNNVNHDYIVVTSGTKTRREGPICTPSHNGPTCPASYTQAAGPAGYNLTYSPGYYQYTQVIAVYDNDAPTVSASVEAEYCAYDCSGASVVVAISVSDDCTPTDLNVAAYVWPNGDEAAKFAITATLTEVSSGGLLPVGAHKLEVVAFDGCGNTNRVVEDLVIADCKAPAPTCISGIAVELMPYDANGDGTIDDGRMAIHASDYVQGEAFDCAGPVKYSIHLSREPQTAGELSLLDQIEQFVVNGDMELGDLLDSDHASDLVTCADAGKTLMAVIAAWDANGNGDYCETFLIVQDNMNLCGGSAGPAVAGLIATETNNTVENVEVNLSGQMTDNKLTTTDGNYAFINLQSGYDYTITPLLDEDHDNGVTTFDLIEIGKHILTVKPLGSPYKMIAADVDNNRTITTLDLIQLRRLILSVDREFANNTSWRFVDASYQFPNPSNPWATDFPEIININDLEGSELSGDFVAIKVGDVTLDARANSLMTGSRSTAGTFTLETADIEMKAGGEYTVSFTAINLADIQGYQFTLNLDESVELTEITYGIASAEHFGTTHLAEGALTTSWNAALAPPAVQTRFIASPKPEGPLFSLTLRPTADLSLSQALTLTSRYTLAEAYNQKGQALAVALDFKTGETAAAVELYQNTPNPFKGETVVGFSLPEAASAKLTVTDVTGKVLRIIKGEYARGYNQISLNSAQLPATGVLYYTLETGDFTATKKMVIVP